MSPVQHFDGRSIPMRLASLSCQEGFQVMAQQDFGRRQSQPRNDSDTSGAGRRAARENGRSFSATDAGRSPGKSITILTAVGGLVVFAAVGGVFAFNAATRAAPAQQHIVAAAAPSECRGQADCSNQYDVELSCGSSGEARTVSVVAIDADIAESKAERYNRECRSRSVVFVSSMGKSTAVNAVTAARNLADRKAADHKASNTKASNSGSTRPRLGRR